MVLSRLRRTLVKCDFFRQRHVKSYLATVDLRLQDLENSNKLVLDKIKYSISTTAFNDFAEIKNRLDAFEEELHEIKDDLESLKEKCKSMNNAILTNPVPIQINGTTPPTHTDNPKMHTIVSQISRSID